MNFWIYVAVIFIAGAMGHRLVSKIEQPIETFEDFLRIFGNVLEIVAFGIILKFYW